MPAMFLLLLCVYSYA